MSSTIAAAIRRVLVGIPVSLTSVARKRVKNVKLKRKPMMMPSGRFLLPPTAPESTIGRIGKIHGERIVTIPAKNANPNRIIIYLSSVLTIALRVSISKLVL